MNHTPFAASHAVADGNGGFTLIGDTDPLGDVCSTAADQNTFAGKNIGDLLNAKSITWGWFEGGFDLDHHQRQRHDGLRAQTSATVPARGHLDRLHPAPRAVPVLRRTANPTHMRPSASRPSATAGGRRGDDGPGQPPVRQPRLLRRAAGRQLPCGRATSRRRPSRTVTPATPTRSTSRTSSPAWSRPSRRAGVGDARPSSSPTTTRTAGTTTRRRRS